ncbi:hypothetical protein C8J56DRAFT_58383, partial [Mycena floridula]
MSTTPEGRPATPVAMSRKCPVADCDQQVDIVLKSSDGFLIGAHRCNMGRFSDGFPSAEAVTITSLEEVVPLAETKAVLDMLLYFLHPRSLPTCDELDFGTLLALAYAAEKYLVYLVTSPIYGLIHWVSARFRKLASQRPKGIVT